MLNQNDIETIAERDVYDSDGAKIGAARQVYVDDETGEPEWVTVRTGLFGLNESFVPLADATVSEDRLVPSRSASSMTTTAAAATGTADGTTASARREATGTSVTTTSASSVRPGPAETPPARPPTTR